VLAGLLGAVWVTGLIRSRLVGITPADPLVLGGAVGLMVLIALFAAFAPAWRASRVDPISALRYE
jgi:putative ABC transport system permease protein